MILVRGLNLSAIAAALGFILSAGAVHGQITVCPDGTCDFTSIQAAIDSVDSGAPDTTVIHVFTGTYVEGPINFGGIDVDIIGVDGAENTIFRQNGSSRVVRVQGGNIVRLEGITIKGGAPEGGASAGGGIRVVSGASLELVDCVVTRNETQNNGGGVYVADGATARFEGCVFSDNTTLAGNEPFHGGGLYIAGLDGNTIDRCFFAGNTATGHGGGLYQGRESQDPGINQPYPQLRNSIFTANVAGLYGGGAYVLPALADCLDGTMFGYVTNCTFADNTAYAEGAIYGNEPTDCGGKTDVPTPSIVVVNSINWDNGPGYTGDNPTTWNRCVIDVLSEIDGASDCSDIYPRFITGPFTGLQSRTLAPGSLCIDASSAGVQLGFVVPILIDFGALDAGGRDRAIDSPLTSGAKGADSVVDIGAQEFTIETLTDLGMCIWVGGSAPADLADSANWYGGEVPAATNVWVLDEDVNAHLDDDFDLNSVYVGSGSLSFHEDSTGTFSTNGFYLGFYGGQGVRTTLAEDMEFHCSVLSIQRGRFYMEGATVEVTGSVTISQEESNAGTAGVRIGTVHGPGTIRGPASAPGEFDPFLLNEGRIRVDDLIEIDGDFEQGAGSVRFEIRPNSPGLGAGQKMTITGQASLGGAVVFAPSGSWNPEVGSSYEILAAEQGFVEGADSFDFAVTQWANDPRFFVLSTVENVNGTGSSIFATVLTLDALFGEDESLDSAGIALEDMLLVDVDGDGAKDLVLSVDTGEGSDGQVVILLNLGNDGSWQGFESFASVTGITVGENPRGLDAGFIDVGSELEGANYDLMVANQGDGTVSVLQNNSVVGSIDFATIQTLDLTEGGVNDPRPIDVCSLNLDGDAEGYSDLVVSCLDASVWTFQNLNATGNFNGVDPLGNETKEDRPRTITRFSPGFGGGGGKRGTGPRDATGNSSDDGVVESGGVSTPLSGTGGGIQLTWTTYVLPNGSAPEDLARADFNADGFDDLVCANVGDDSLSFMMGTAEGVYASPVTVALDATYVEALSIAAGDVDGDGDIDLVLICSSPAPSSGFQRVTRIIRNTLSDGSYGWVFTGDESLRGQEPYLVRSADVDGDGTDDIIALTEFPGGSLAGEEPTYGFASVSLEEAVVCAQDLNGDDQVSGADLAVLLGAWGACSGSCVADFDESGAVDGADLATLLGAWGPCDVGAQ